MFSRIELTCILDYNHRSSWLVCQRICGHIDGFQPWRIRRRCNAPAHQTHLNSRALYCTQVDSQCTGHYCTRIVRWRKCCYLSFRNPFRHSCRHNLWSSKVKNENLSFKSNLLILNASNYHPPHRSDIVNEYIWSFDMWIPEVSTFCIGYCRICLRHYIHMKTKPKENCCKFWSFEKVLHLIFKMFTFHLSNRYHGHNFFLQHRKKVEKDWKRKINIS